ncbi:MAG: hypothetical protein EBR82_05990 [Caulobacteraceae bacterium]|nr:hypothetical protein [Caulobacteraceae bacterium]
MTKVAPAMVRAVRASGARLKTFDLSRRSGVRLSATSRRVLSVFEGTTEVMDVERAWMVANQPDNPLARSSVYRAIRDLHDKGHLAVNAVLGPRIFFQLTRDVPLINLVDVERETVTTFVDEGLAEQIRAVIATAGFDLAGGIDLRVTRKR